MTLLCVTDSRPPSAAGARAAHQIVRADRCASAETASMGCAAGWLGMRAGGLSAAALVAEMSEHGAAGAKLRRSTADGVAGPGAQKLPGCHRLLQLPWKCGCEGPKKEEGKAFLHSRNLPNHWSLANAFAISEGVWHKNCCELCLKQGHTATKARGTIRPTESKQQTIRLWEQMFATCGVRTHACYSTSDLKADLLDHSSKVAG